MDVMVRIIMLTFCAVWLLFARVTFVTTDDVVAGTGRRTITAGWEMVAKS